MLSNIIYIYNSYQAALAGQGDANPEYWENKWEEVCKRYNCCPEDTAVDIAEELHNRSGGH